MTELSKLEVGYSKVPAPVLTPAPLPRKHTTILRGIGTAVPPYAADQQTACAFMQRVLSASFPEAADRLGLLKRLYSRSGIERRHSVMADYVCDNPDDFQFFPNNWMLDPFPTTAARMQMFEDSAVELAAEAARRALAASSVAPEEVTHLVISTCTGFFAPGPDILLVRRLGLATSVARTVLGFMGCYAGLSALRTCHEIVQADPEAVVLQVSVELCSLHYQKSLEPDSLVANAIFSDGAAAAIYCSSTGMQEELLSPVAVVKGTRTDITPDSSDHMSWRIGDHGFVMTLDQGVPAVLQKAAPAFTQSLAEAARIPLADIAGWAIHPGGRKIVEAIQDSLGLTDDDVASSTNVLRDYGNMSSATVLFVLQQEIARRASGDHIASMAFGPGLTMEGAMLTVA